jgi:hypothetical protein
VSVGAEHAIQKAHAEFEASLAKLAEEFRTRVRDVAHALGRASDEVDAELADQSETVKFHGLSRLDFVRFLTEAAVACCGYGGGRCDCKFGRQEGNVTHGEQTGCPEFSVLAEMFAVMGEDDFAYLASRAQNLMRRGQMTKSEEIGAEAARKARAESITRRQVRSAKMLAEHLVEQEAREKKRALRRIAKGKKAR